jgi:hypothetical protein
MDHGPILYLVAAGLLGLAYVGMRLPLSHGTTTWLRLVALTLRLIGLILLFSISAIVGILFVLFVMDRRLHGVEQLGLCIDIGVLVGILCGTIAHIALLPRATRRSIMTALRQAFAVKD